MPMLLPLLDLDVIFDFRDCQTGTFKQLLLLKRTKTMITPNEVDHTWRDHRPKVVPARPRTIVYLRPHIQRMFIRFDTEFRIDESYIAINNKHAEHIVSKGLVGIREASTT